MKKLLNIKINNIFKCAKKYIDKTKNIKFASLPNNLLGFHWWDFIKFNKLDKNRKINFKCSLKKIKIDFNKLSVNNQFELKLYNLVTNNVDDIIIESLNIRKYNKPGEYKYRDFNLNFDSVSGNILYKWHIYQ